jgi:hypothetical protein
MPKVRKALNISDPTRDPGDADENVEPPALSLVPTIELSLVRIPLLLTRCAKRVASLPIVLDGVDVAGGCFIGIESRIASGAALAEEIPALI